MSDIFLQFGFVEKNINKKRFIITPIATRISGEKYEINSIVDRFSILKTFYAD